MKLQVKFFKVSLKGELPVLVRLPLHNGQMDGRQFPLIFVGTINYIGTFSELRLVDLWKVHHSSNYLTALYHSSRKVVAYLTPELKGPFWQLLQAPLKEKKSTRGRELYRSLLLMAEKKGVHQLRLVVYPIIFRVSYIPGGARFQPSTVSFAQH